MKSIIIEPFAGLANRMRVVASGLWLQEKLHAKLRCVWNESNELNAPFEMLFKPIEGLDVTLNLLTYKTAKASNQPSLIKRVAASLINRRLGIDYCIKEPNLIKTTWHANANVSKIASKYNSLYFFTCEEFGDTKTKYALFKPIEEIQSKIDLLTNKFTKETIGVHIRRTDNEKAISTSPLDLYIEKMDEAIKNQAMCNFYLSTDDSLVEQELIRKYGQLIITHQKEYSRETIKGIQDAVVDLYCLANTSKLIGSYWSSFTDVAAKIGNIDLDIVMKKQ